jgi:hypothetical protein
VLLIRDGWKGKEMRDRKLMRSKYLRLVAALVVIALALLLVSRLL